MRCIALPLSLPIRIEAFKRAVTQPFNAHSRELQKVYTKVLHFYRKHLSELFYFQRITFQVYFQLGFSIVYYFKFIPRKKKLIIF